MRTTLNAARRWLVAAFVIAAAAGGGVAAEAESADANPATVIRGVVAAVDPCGLVILDDGTIVELAAWSQKGGGTGLSAPSPGDEVVVVGRFPVGDGTGTVKAGEVRVARSGRNRRVPVDNVVCRGVPPDVGLERLRMAGAMPAAEKRLKSDPEAEFEGIVTRLNPNGFMLRDADKGDFEVVVDEHTEFSGVSSLADLEVGDDVTAKGELDGIVLTANLIERHGGNGDGGGDGGGGDQEDEGVEFETTGRLIDLRPPDRFVLDDHRVYRVDAGTGYDDTVVSYSGLMVGQFLEVKARYLGEGDYLAVEIEYEGEDDEGQGYRSIDGIVSSVGGAGLTLADGESVLFTPATEFDGDSDRAEDIRPGWWVDILAIENAAGDLLARRIRSDDRSVPTTEGDDFEPHDALVMVAEGVDRALVAERHDATIAGSVGSRVVLMRWNDEIDDGLLARLDADPEISAVEPNYRFRDPESVRRRYPVIDRSPRRSKYTLQVAVAQANLTSALSLADGEGTVVAVMDSGVDPCHPLLRGHLIAGGLDLVDGDFEPWEDRNGIDEDGDGDVDEAFGHGTFVASVLALAAPGARILPYRVLDSDGGGTAFDVALALADAIDRGVDVINLSLAYHRRSTVVDLLLEDAAARGIVVVAAAGNDAVGTLPFPASDSHVLAVAALSTDGDRLADFSNWGPDVIVAAPGEKIYGGLAGGEFGTASGTSVAAPFAAAGAALLKGLDSAVSPDIVGRLLVEAGVPISVDGGAASALDLGEAVLRVVP